MRPLPALQEARLAAGDAQAPGAPAPPATDLGAARALAGLATALGLAWMAAPVARAPMSLALGAPDGEGAAHLWGLVTAARGLGRHGPFVRDSTLVAWPGGARLDLVDPLHLLLVAPLDALAGLPGATLAWNLLHLLHLLALSLGAWALGRQLAPDRPLVAAVATAGAVGTPYLWGGLPLGRSELLGLALVLPLLALLARTWGPRWQVGRLVAAVLALAALAHCGWQPLLLAGLVLAPAVLVLAGQARVPPGRLAARLVAVLLPAAALCLPMLLAHLGTAPWWLDRLGGLESLGADAPPVELPGALRLDAWRPAFDTAVPPYLGLVALALAARAAWRSPRALGLLALGLAVLCLGPRFTPGEAFGRWLGPAWLVARAVPLVGGLNDWGRLALAVGPLVALAGAVGLGPALDGRRGRLLALGVGALLLLDGGSWRLRAPAAFDTRPPPPVARVYAALPEGAVLELPGEHPVEKADQADSDRSMLWSLAHGHPVQAAPSPHGSPMLPRSALVRLHEEPERRRPDPCLRTESGRLHALGFRAVVLHEERLGEAPADELVARLSPLLGPPAGREEGLTWWRLRPGQQGPPRCAPPPLGSEGRKETGPARFGPPPRSRDWDRVQPAGFSSPPAPPGFSPTGR
ncbi:hypothetical protein L6R53_31335 [Myxococcota bacterium]|nr:hypothetical protein [Myxococcota bacterium]